MNPFIIVVVVALVAGIVYLSSDVEKKDARRKHLKALVQLLNGKMSEIGGRPNSFGIDFEYRKVPFLYEDIEDKIFDKVVYRGFLRLNLPIHFNVVFTEKIKSSIVALGRGAAGAANKIESPRGLKDFLIYSNRTDVAQRLLEDEACVRVFLKFKNKDARGKPELALEIVDGVLILKFYPLGHQLQPTIFDLRSNVTLIEDFVEDMLVIHRRVQKIMETI